MRRSVWLYGLFSVLALASGANAVGAQPDPPGQLTIAPDSGRRGRRSR